MAKRDYTLLDYLERVISFYLQWGLLVDALIVLLVFVFDYFLNFNKDEPFKEFLYSSLLTMLSTLFGFLVTAAIVIATFKRSFEDGRKSTSGEPDNKEFDVDKKISKETQIYGTDLVSFVLQVFKTSILECSLLLVALIVFNWLNLLDRVGTVGIFLFVGLSSILFIRNVYMFRLILGPKD